MATNDTIYRIINQYEVQDRTTKKVRSMERSMTKASASGLGLKRILLGLGGMFAARAAFGLGKRALIDYNSQLEQAKIQTATILRVGFGGSMQKNLGRANDLVGELQKRAAKSTATTEEMVFFMSNIAGPVTKAGLAMKDLGRFTASAVVAAKVFGEERTAGFDVKQALTAGVTIKDRFANQLLQIEGIERTAFNKLKVNARLRVLQRALDSKAIQGAAEAQAGSFAGVTSTLKDNMQIALGKIGIPLMKRLTAEAKKAVKWISSAEGMMKIKDLSDKIGKSLVTGFGAMKSTLTFFVDHHSKLMTLAKIALLLKAGSMIGGLGGRATAFLDNAKSASMAMAVFAGAVEAGAPAIGKFVGALGLIYGAAKGAAWLLNKGQEANIGQRTAGVSRESNIQLALRSQGRFAAKFIQEEIASGRIKMKEGGVVRGRNTTFTFSAARHQKIYEKALEYQTNRLPKAIAFALYDRLKLVIPAFGEDDDMKKADKTKVDVKIEIPARDPDAFAREFNDAMEEIAARPATASAVIGRTF